jgi:hypothetical protein
VSVKTDAKYGRRGGRFIADGYTPTDIAAAPRCAVCDRPMLVGQATRHAVCEPTTDQETTP